MSKTEILSLPAFEGNTFRGFIIDGKEWFVAADACRCLGFDISKGTGQFLRPMDGDEKHTITREEYPEKFSGFRGREITLVSEAGLYRLIFRSYKPEAKRFDRWVRHEVLPQLRQNGGYVMPDADLEAVAAAAPTNTKRTDLDLMKSVMDAMEAMRARIGELEADNAVDAAS